MLNVKFRFFDTVIYYTVTIKFTFYVHVAFDNLFISKIKFYFLFK